MWDPTLIWEYADWLTGWICRVTDKLPWLKATQSHQALSLGSCADSEGTAVGRPAVEQGQRVQTSLAQSPRGGPYKGLWLTPERGEVRQGAQSGRFFVPLTVIPKVLPGSGSHLSRYGSLVSWWFSPVWISLMHCTDIRMYPEESQVAPASPAQLCKCIWRGKCLLCLKLNL